MSNAAVYLGWQSPSKRSIFRPVSRKGTAGDPGISLLNLGWWYNWNISSSSSRDLEYTAIRQNRWWPGLGQDWKALGMFLGVLSFFTAIYFLAPEVESVRHWLCPVCGHGIPPVGVEEPHQQQGHDGDDNGQLGSK